MASRIIGKSVSLRIEQIEQLEDQSDDEGRSESQIVRDALDEYWAEEDQEEAEADA